MSAAAVGYPLARKVFITGWISFLVNLLLVATGGAVRLTGSGLGCETWPTCDGTHIVATPEQGIHGLIEFGNRTLSGAVALAAIAVLWAVWDVRKTRRDLWWLAVVVGLGVVAQAVVGGFSVLSKLNPFLVGFHYIASVTLVCVMAAFLVRANRRPGPRTRVVSPSYARIAWITGVFVVLTIIMGILTTGAGPHSGDTNAVRNGFNVVVLEHLHAWPAYFTFLGTVALFAGSFRYASRLRGWASTMLLIVLTQVTVGLIQANTGLPAILVGIHMVLAALLGATMTVILLKLSEPAPVAATPAAEAEVLEVQ